MSFVHDPKAVEELRRSKEQVGYLQNVKVNRRTGKILDGKTRKIADPQWPEELIDVKDDLQEELIILHSNVRRLVSEAETKLRLERIALILVARGIPKERVCAEVYKLVPFTERYVRQLLPKEYKMPTVAGSGERKAEPAPLLASEKSTDSRDMQVPSALSGSLDSKGDLPFADCKCAECNHKDSCY